MKTRNMVRRVCQLVFTALIVIGVSVGLSVCKSDDQMARDSAETMLRAFKNPTEESMRPYMSNAKTAIISQIESYNIDSLTDAFAAASIDYQSTDTATLAQIYQEGSAAGLEKKLMELLYKRLDEASDLTPTKATIKLAKEGGSWKVDDGSVQDFASSMYGSISLSGEEEPASQTQEPAPKLQEPASE